MTVPTQHDSPMSPLRSEAGAAARRAPAYSLADASVDIAIASQALHHANDPAVALSEARRILRPGGRVLVLDLRQHEEAWVQDSLGDRWLGFTSERLEALLTGAGFEQVTVRTGARKAGDPFAVLIATGTRTK